jgi:hypothetical protein
MLIGTLFTLFVTPAVYTFVARDHRLTGGRANLHVVEDETLEIPKAAE